MVRFWQIDSVMPLLPTNHAVPDSIPLFGMEFFLYNCELFHGMYGLSVSMSFVLFLSTAVLERGTPIVSVSLYMVHSNFLPITVGRERKMS